MPGQSAQAARHCRFVRFDRQEPFPDTTTAQAGEYHSLAAEIAF
jgi:hypothetical protein